LGFTFWFLPFWAFACEALVFTLWLKTKASQAKAQKGKNQKVKPKRARRGGEG
jgi:hypothetical protein